MIKSLVLLFIGIYLVHADVNLNLPPEASWNFTELVSALNYPYEEHKIATEDGYILTFFRIQAKNTQIRSGLPPVLVNHGLLDSSDGFVVNDESQAVGYILANAGFDVWFTNNRGNKYSLEHVNGLQYNAVDPDSAFWDFSWQEMSTEDLPAALRYIAVFTGRKVHYVGHSEGTTIMFAALARRDPIVLQHLDKFIALAPAVFLQHSTSPLVQIGGWIKAGYILKALDGLINMKKFGFTSPAMAKAWGTLCTVALPICIARVRLISDSNTKVDNVKRLPIFVGHYPAGSSIQNLYYWSQMFNQKEFKMYDFGKAGNEKNYGTSTPPVYDLGKIQEEVFIFVGEYDELASPADTATLRSKLTGSPRVEYRRYPLGHSTFLNGLDVAGYMQDVTRILLE